MTIRVCIHGHAYQPPREDPLTGEVPLQPSAAPYHDWNERITDECYRPYGGAEVRDADGAVVERFNLWGVTSFDLGPTLGVWFDRHAADVSATIAAGDAGFAGAMAHPWVHAILPLTPHTDRATIVRWGVADFRSRFGRRPTGMWLPETAVDVPSLEALADEGISWTLLAPHQVRRVAGDSTLVEPAHRPLVVDLPSGREFVVVPYDGVLSHAIAFDGLLHDGVKLAARIAAIAGDDESGLVVAATDLETFGHHHRHGEMALAKAVQVLRDRGDVEFVAPERYLAEHPATERGVLVPWTSWSCAHGIERWRSDCGCRFEDVPGRDQRWRGQLRDHLNSIADLARRLLGEFATADLADPWAARDAWGDVLSARGADRARHLERWTAEHVAPGGSPERAVAWMEAERLRLEAWSSCAWFFDSIDRIETVQALREADAALERYRDLTGRPAGGLHPF